MATLVLRAACAIATLCLACSPALAQGDPGIRGGFQNTADTLHYRGVPILPPPIISPHPTTGATITANELASLKEGILRAGQFEATCDECAMVTGGAPVTGRGELDPTFRQFTTNSNGLGARLNADRMSRRASADHTRVPLFFGFLEYDWDPNARGGVPGFDSWPKHDPSVADTGPRD